MQTTRITEAKQRLLSDSGYSYDIDHYLYFNRDSKKAFSIAFIQDESREKIEQLIHKTTADPQWQFFFNTAPSNYVKQELVSALA